MVEFSEYIKTCGWSGKEIYNILSYKQNDLTGVIFNYLKVIRDSKVNAIVVVHIR